jgi:hypothetical protein
VIPHFQARRAVDYQHSKENNMSDASEDLKILTVLATRLVEQRLPRLMLLKAQVDRGEVLGDYDIRFMKEALGDAQGNAALIERHPEVQELAGRIVHLFKEIMDKAVVNQQNSAS